MMLWKMKTAGLRTVQAGLGLAMHVIPWRKPVMANYPGAVAAIPAALQADGISRVLIVTDKGVLQAGLLQCLTGALAQAGVNYETYCDVKANPTIPNCLAGLKRFRRFRAEGVIAVGGGSAMDCSKMITALAAVPDGSEKKLGGLFRVTLLQKRPLPTLYCVPTTAGTGSETTIVAVVTDPDTHAKYTVMDLPLMPRRIFLDADLTLTMPPRITANSGMDALVHAVEAYLNRYMATPETRRQALSAVQLIFRYLPRAHANGKDMEARDHMLTAAYLAGQAFGRATVGYAHSIAHAVGGEFNWPHGALTGMLLPPLLEWYGEAAVPRLAELAEAVGIAEPGDSEAGKARTFIQEVYALRRELGLPDHLPQMTEAQRRLICHRAIREANPLYPVPRIMNERECRAFVKMLEG